MASSPCCKLRRSITSRCGKTRFGPGKAFTWTARLSATVPCSRTDRMGLTGSLSREYHVNEIGQSKKKRRFSLGGKQRQNCASERSTAHICHPYASTSFFKSPRTKGASFLAKFVVETVLLFLLLLSLFFFTRVAYADTKKEQEKKTKEKKKKKKKNNQFLPQYAEST